MVQLTDIHQSQSLRSSSITCRACSSMFLFPCNLAHLITFLKVALYAVICGLAGLIFFYIGVSMGWLYVVHFRNNFEDVLTVIL